MNANYWFEYQFLIDGHTQSTQSFATITDEGQLSSTLEDRIVGITDQASNNMDSPSRLESTTVPTTPMPTRCQVILKWQTTDNNRCCFVVLTQPAKGLFSQLASLENELYDPNSNHIEAATSVTIELGLTFARTSGLKESLQDIEFPTDTNFAQVFAVIG